MQKINNDSLFQTLFSRFNNNVTTFLSPHEDWFSYFSISSRTIQLSFKKMECNWHLSLSRKKKKNVCKLGATKNSVSQFSLSLSLSFMNQGSNRYQSRFLSFDHIVKIPDKLTEHARGGLCKRITAHKYFNIFNNLK